MSGEGKKLIQWLQEVGRDEEVLNLFWEGRLDEAVDKGAEKHPLGDDEKKLLKENNLERILRKLEEEQEDLRSGGHPMFWVLVRV